MPRRVAEDEVALLNRVRQPGSGIVMPFADENNAGLLDT